MVSVTDAQYPLPQSEVTASTADTPFSVIAAPDELVGSVESGVLVHPPKRAAETMAVIAAARKVLMIRSPSEDRFSRLAQSPDVARHAPFLLTLGTAIRRDRLSALTAPTIAHASRLATLLRRPQPVLVRRRHRPHREPLFSGAEPRTPIATVFAAGHLFREPCIPRRLLALRCGPRRTPSSRHPLGTPPRCATILPP